MHAIRTLCNQSERYCQTGGGSVRYNSGCISHFVYTHYTNWNIDCCCVNCLITIDPNIEILQLKLFIHLIQFCCFSMEITTKLKLKFRWMRLHCIFSSQVEWMRERTRICIFCICWHSYANVITVYFVGVCISTHTNEASFYCGTFAT